MIWFGKVERLISEPIPEALGLASESVRMKLALERVAETAPGLGGSALVDAIASTGFVDRTTAARLLPTFRHFDADRHFAEHLRRLSFRGRLAADQFRTGIRCVVEEITGSGLLDQVGPEPCVRFAADAYEGVILAQPEVGMTIAGRTRDALLAAIEEMPDVVVVVARNFEKGASDQLQAILGRSGVPGTLVTLNLLLGIRATTLRYQPRLDRVVSVLAKGGTLRSADIAPLGDR
jgi:hypothetical protein